MIVILLVRRYLCLACGGVATVVPRGVLYRRLFSAAAIALALALFGIERETEAEVRRRTSPWPVVGTTAVTGWLSLHRWIGAIREKRLFALVLLGTDWTTRQIAARAATVLAGRAPAELRGVEVCRAAFAGAPLW